MNVSQAIDILRESELKQLKVKDDKAAVRGFINLGILEIYKRFDLWNAEAIITLVDGVSVYTLDGVDANVSIDLADKQFLVTEECWNNEGERMTINDTEDPYGVATPKYNQIEVGPEILVPGNQVSVIYRAAPLDLVHEKEVIDLPPQFNEALFHYVGYRGHGSVNAELKTENNSHYTRFEASCNRVQWNGLGERDDVETYKFEQRGFV